MMAVRADHIRGSARKRALPPMGAGRFEAG
jgi:hypothetical protein